MSPPSVEDPAATPPPDAPVAAASGGGLHGAGPPPGRGEHQRRQGPVFAPHADLARVDWSWSELAGSDLRGTRLHGARLRHANLHQAKLEGVQAFDLDLEGVDLSGSDLSGAHLPRAVLLGANLSGCSLREARLPKADLREADLRYADLRGADFQGADLARALLEGASWEGANFRSAKLGRTRGLPPEEVRIRLAIAEARSPRPAAKVATPSPTGEEPPSADSSPPNEATNGPTRGSSGLLLRLGALGPELRIAWKELQQRRQAQKEEALRQEAEAEARERAEAEARIARARRAADAQAGRLRAKAKAAERAARKARLAGQTLDLEVRTTVPAFRGDTAEVAAVERELRLKSFEVAGEVAAAARIDAELQTRLLENRARALESLSLAEAEAQPIWAALQAAILQREAERQARQHELRRRQEELVAQAALLYPSAPMELAAPEREVSTDKQDNGPNLTPALLELEDAGYPIEGAQPTSELVSPPPVRATPVESPVSRLEGAPELIVEPSETPLDAPSPSESEGTDSASIEAGILEESAESSRLAGSPIAAAAFGEEAARLRRKSYTSDNNQTEQIRQDTLRASQRSNLRDEAQLTIEQRRRVVAERLAAEAEEQVRRNLAAKVSQEAESSRKLAATQRTRQQLLAEASALSAQVKLHEEALRLAREEARKRAQEALAAARKPQALSQGMPSPEEFDAQRKAVGDRLRRQAEEAELRENEARERLELESRAAEEARLALELSQAAEAIGEAEEAENERLNISLLQAQRASQTEELAQTSARRRTEALKAERARLEALREQSLRTVNQGAVSQTIAARLRERAENLLEREAASRNRLEAEAAREEHEQRANEAQERALREAQQRRIEAAEAAGKLAKEQEIREREATIARRLAERKSLATRKEVLPTRTPANTPPQLNVLDQTVGAQTEEAAEIAARLRSRALEHQERELAGRSRLEAEAIAAAAEQAAREAQEAAEAARQREEAFRKEQQERLEREERIRSRERELTQRSAAARLARGQREAEAQLGFEEQRRAISARLKAQAEDLARREAEARSRLQAEAEAESVREAQARLEAEAATRQAEAERALAELERQREALQAAERQKEREQAFRLATNRNVRGRLGEEQARALAFQDLRKKTQAARLDAAQRKFDELEEEARLASAHARGEAARLGLISQEIEQVNLSERGASYASAAQQEAERERLAARIAEVEAKALQRAVSRTRARIEALAGLALRSQQRLAELTGQTRQNGEMVEPSPSGAVDTSFQAELEAERLRLESEEAERLRGEAIAQAEAEALALAEAARRAAEARVRLSEAEARRLDATRQSRTAAEAAEKARLAAERARVEAALAERRRQDAAQLARRQEAQDIRQATIRRLQDEAQRQRLRAAEVRQRTLAEMSEVERKRAIEEEQEALRLAEIAERESVIERGRRQQLDQTLRGQEVAIAASVLRARREAARIQRVRPVAPEMRPRVSAPRGPSGWSGRVIRLVERLKPAQGAEGLPRGPGLDLRGMDLSKRRLPNQEWPGADLRAANLQSTDLSEGHLEGARLDEAQLMGALLARADLRAASMEGAGAQGVDLRGAQLGHANLRGILLEDADLRDADLTGADLTGADLSGADLRGARLSGALFLGAKMLAVRAGDLDFGDANLEEADFEQADLSGALLNNARVTGARFAGAMGLSEAERQSLARAGAISRESGLEGVLLGLGRGQLRVAAAVLVLGLGAYFASRELASEDPNALALEASAEELRLRDPAAAAARYAQLAAQANRVTDKVAYLVEAASLAERVVQGEDGVEAADGYYQAAMEAAGSDIGLAADIRLKAASWHARVKNWDAVRADLAPVLLADVLPAEVRAKAIIGWEESSAALLELGANLEIDDDPLKRVYASLSGLVEAEADLRLAVAEQRSFRGDTQGALAELAIVDGLDLPIDQRITALEGRARVLDRDGRADEAAEAWRALMEQAQDGSSAARSARIALADLEARRDNTEEALRLLAPLLTDTEHPRSLARALLLEGRIQLRAGAADKARASWQKVLEMTGLEPEIQEEARVAIARLLLSSNDPAAAAAAIEGLPADAAAAILVQARLGEGRGLLDEGRAEDALRLFQALNLETQANSALDPSLRRAARAGEAEALAILGSLQEAVEIWREQLSMDPTPEERAWIELQLAHTLLQGGDRVEAGYAFASLAEAQDPDVRAQGILGLAEVSRSAGERSKARDLYRQVAETAADPEYQVQAWQELADMAVEDERGEDARSAWRGLLGVVPPGHPAAAEARISLLLSLGEAGDLEAAAALCAADEEADDPSLVAHAAITCGELFERTGNTKEAMRRYEAAIAALNGLTDSDSLEQLGDGAAGLARVAVQAGNADLAVRTCQESLKKLVSPERRLALLGMLAEAEDARGNASAAAVARQEQEAITQENPQLAGPFLVERALRQREVGDTEAAVVSLESALALLQGTEQGVQTRLELADTLLAAGRFQDAATNFSVAQTEAEPGSTLAFDAGMGAVEAERQGGNPKEALNLLDSLSAPDEERQRQLIEAKANLEGELGEGGLAGWEALVEATGDDPEGRSAALRGQADALMGEGRHGEAIAAYIEAEKVAGSPDAVAWARLGRARGLIYTGDLEGAQALLEPLRAAPDPEVALQAGIDLVQALGRQGRHAEALAVLEGGEGQELGAGWDASVVEVRANVMLGSGDWRGAISAWEALIERWPGEEEALLPAALGISNAWFVGGDLKKALDHAQLAVESAKDPGYRKQAELALARLQKN